MRVHTRHTPNFGVARIALAPGEAVQAAPETVLANSFGITGSRAPKTARARLAPSVYTAPDGGGWIDLAPRAAGDVYPIEFDATVGWNVAADAVLARPATVRIDQPWPELQKLFGGDSGFLEHFSGSGPLVLAAVGPVDALNLAAGEVVTVASGFLLAYPDPVQCRLRALDPSGPQSVRTGEGLVIDFAGPGTVLVQTRVRGG